MKPSRKTDTARRQGIETPKVPAGRGGLFRSSYPRCHRCPPKPGLCAIPYPRVAASVSHSGEACVERRSDNRPAEQSVRPDDKLDLGDEGGCKSTISANSSWRSLRAARCTSSARWRRGLPSTSARSERRRGVRDDEESLNPQVARHPGCRRNTEVGRQSYEDDRGDAGPPEPGFEIGPDERAVDALVVDRFVLPRRGLGFGCVARRSATHPPARGGRVVMNVYDRRPGPTPQFDQGGHVGLGREIVARSPGWVVKAHLHIDDQKGWIPVERLQTCSPGR